ncbi:MAG: DNA polymerase III subunit delta [Gammaproteobacteria bacterium HGW-Gammaproteobacteria-1]|jgi:DNA polymerase-3 subunit delta|nr:MAG: DNA polymerase III subunit delta [Gammaproteobacteria bacterium HGW-Gammaproteobacteria-1]
MRLRPEQLPAHVERPLLPIYLVSGDEPLQLNEATDALRAAARAQGFGEREVLQVETGFDWAALAAAGSNLSLFAERKLIELRLPSGKPGDAGAKALTAYAAAPSPDNLLLISCGKLEKQQQSSKWFKALEAAGAVVQVWPVEPRALPGWIRQRLLSRGMQPTSEAAQLLAERVEGNMLAAAQEVEKLVLLHGAGPLDGEAVRAAVADSARYDVFELADAALGGDAARCARIIEGLRGEGEEPVLILWALVREVRSLALIAAEQAGGAALDTLLQQQRVWDKRKPLYQAALKRHNLRRWRALLRRAARLDRICKGAEPGTPWDELLQFSLLMAGVRIV